MHTPDTNTASVPRIYTVCFLFSDDLSQVLLQIKQKTGFKGMLNGVGGVVDPHETAHVAALRKIKDETGLSDPISLSWIGTLDLPEDCGTGITSSIPEHPACVLHFYAAACDTHNIYPGQGKERVAFFPVHEVLSQNCPLPLAGDGDLPYFIRRGRDMLFASMPVY